MELVLPFATLEPVRELLLQMFIGEKFGRDSIWEGHLTGELWQTELPIRGVLDEIELPLGEVLNWKEGSRIELNCAPDSMVQLRCGDIVMSKGHMGRKGPNIAIRIINKMTPDASR